jgi:hypothetical protein
MGLSVFGARVHTYRRAIKNIVAAQAAAAKKTKP